MAESQCLRRGTLVASRYKNPAAAATLTRFPSRATRPQADLSLATASLKPVGAATFPVSLAAPPNRAASNLLLPPCEVEARALQLELFAPVLRSLGASTCRRRLWSAGTGAAQIKFIVDYSDFGELFVGLFLSLVAVVLVSLVT